MKLRVVELLLISTIPAMILAEKGVPSLGLVIATLVGGTLAAGSANAFNMVLESDLDTLMERTSKRPLVTGAIGKTHAAIFATVIGALSLFIFWVFTEPLATLLTAIAIAFYVMVYTMALKRHTSQNIVWGGAAGCMPVFIGWAAELIRSHGLLLHSSLSSSSGLRHISGHLPLNIRMITKQHRFLCFL